MPKIRVYRVTQADIKAVWDEAFEQGERSGECRVMSPRLHDGSSYECEKSWRNSVAQTVYPFLTEATDE